MQSNTDFIEMLAKTRENIARFQELEQKDWDEEATLLELVKQVGELSKLVLMKKKYYLSDRENDPNYEVAENSIAAEIGDIFLVLIRLCDLYEINFVEACMISRNEEEKFLDSLQIKG